MAGRYPDIISPRSIQPLLILLALAVAVAPLRPRLVMAHLDVPDGGHAEHGHAHHHEHTHDGVTHTHVHHHHHDEGADEDHSEDHHGVLDHDPDLPQVSWTAARRTEVDAPPIPPCPAVAVAPVGTGWLAQRRGKPPPRAPACHPQLSSIRVTILRL